jgi:hypothetical protein
MKSDHPATPRDDSNGQITPFPGASPRAMLLLAAQPWIQRGYALVYEDDHLVELAREDTTPGRWIAGLALAGGVVAALSIAGAAVIWRRARRWRIISLAASPERKVVAHAYRSGVAPGPMES